MGDYIHTTRESDRAGEASSQTTMAYARTEGGSSPFDLPVEWTWSLHDGSEHPETGQVRGELQVWQPDSMVDVPRTDQQPDLPAVPGRRSRTKAARRRWPVWCPGARLTSAASAPCRRS